MTAQDRLSKRYCHFWLRHLFVAGLFLGLASIHGVSQASSLHPQIRFEQGLKLLLEQDFAGAARVFEALYADTRSERVRLEWARSAYLMQDYEQSKQLFRAVLATDPPLPVREKVNLFLDDISLAQGRLDYSMSMVHDTNPMLIPSNRTFSIFGLPFQYKPQFDTNPRWGMSYRLLASKGLDASRRWIASAGVLGTHFGDPAINRSGFDAHLAYRFQLEPRMEAKVSHESLDIGPKPAYRYSWLTFTHTAITTSGLVRIGNEARLGQIEYPEQSFQNSTLTNYKLFVEKAFGQNFSVALELGLDRGQATEAAYSHSGFAQGIVGTYLNPSIASRVQAKWQAYRRRNDQADPFFHAQREDHRNTISLAIEPTTFRIAQMTPVFELGKERNESTLGLYQYEKLILNLSLKRSY